jgi:hypothetical protein
MEAHMTLERRKELVKHAAWWIGIGSASPASATSKDQPAVPLDE